MSEQRIEAVARSGAPPDAVWRLLSDATTWPSWGPWDAVEIEREGEGGVGAVKRLRTGRYEVREEVVALEPPRRLAYRLLSGIPVRDYDAEVTLAPDGDGTRIEWRAEFRARWPGSGGLIRRRLSGVFQEVVDGLAAAAERG